MPDTSRPGGTRGSADDWSEPSWSDPAYRREEPAAAHSGARSHGDAGWGSPNYSQRSGQEQARAAGGTRTGQRPAGPARGNPPRQPERGHRDNRSSDNRSSDHRSSDNRGSDNRGTDNRGTDGWNEGGPLPARDQRATKAASRRAELDSARTQRSVDKLLTKTSSGRAEAARRRDVDARTFGRVDPRPFERGLNWWAALLVLLVITALGAILDSVADIDGQDGFNYAIVIAALAAILLVKRSQMFPIVVAPPLVYSAAALVQLYIKRSNTSGSSSGLLIDAVQNYLVYGFPALAAATAAALIIAGIRLIARK